MAQETLYVHKGGPCDVGAISATTGAFSSKFGCNGATPQEKYAVGNELAAPSAAYVEAEILALTTMVNKLRTTLINAGLAKAS